MRIIVQTLILSCLPLVAFAQPEDARVKLAQDKFESGQTHFTLQEYKQAITDFEDGYRIKPSSTFLFNIAQCHRLSGNVERAIYFYKAYLRADPEAGNRAEVEARIDALEKPLPPSGTSAPRPATTPPPVMTPATPQPATTPAPVTTQATSPPAPEPQVTTSRERTPLYKKWWLWTTVGIVAAAGVAVGVGVGVKQSGFATSIPDVGPAVRAAALKVSF
jgi:iron complex outermembrane receptor protein